MFSGVIMNKKSQITIFIIVGIVLLIATAMILFIRDKVTDKILVPDLKVTETIPLELNPFKTYVQTCIKDVMVRGIKELGMHGGYIDPNDFDLSQETFSNNYLPTESDVVEFMPGSETYIPYWYYLKSSNDCTGACEFDSKRPNLYKDGLSSIEDQLQRYLIRELPICLNGFETFKEQGYIVTEDGGIQPEVAITSSEVAVLVKYPLDITGPEINAKISQFYVNIDVKLKRIYELATFIVNAQKQYNFLEYNTLSLIAIYSGMDKNKLPPTSDTSFNPVNTLFWTKSNVKTMLSQMLMSNIQALQVHNTLNYKRIMVEPDKKTAQRTYDNMILPLAEDYTDLEAHFNYFSTWPLYFETNSDGELIMPEHMFSEIFSFMGLQRFNSVYDVSYPVMIKLSDPQAFGGDGFNFIYMLETNVRGNQPMASDYAELEIPEVPENSMLCDRGKWNSGVYEIQVNNDLGQNLEDASIAYTCTEESCIIGSTNENGTLLTKLPICFGGRISALKEDHIKASQPLTTLLNQSGSTSLILNKIREFPVEIFKKQFSKSFNGDWQLNSNPMNMLEENQGVITFEYLSSDPTIKYVTAVVFDFSNSEQYTVSLAPGHYDISANLFLDDDVIIPEEERSSSGISYRLPSIQLGGNGQLFPEGGLLLEDYTISSGDVQRSKLTIYLVSMNPLSFTTVEDTAALNYYKDFSVEYLYEFEPRFTN